MTSRSVPALALTAAALLAPAAASASIITFASDPAGSTEGLGAFTGTLTFTPTGPDSATLGVSLTNTSLHAGGRITGFAFQLPAADPGAAAVLSGPSSTHPLFLTTDAPVAAAPFGVFDAGAALGADWIGGGSPMGGIAIGETGLFEFDVTGPGVGGGSAEGYFPVLDGPGAGGPGGGEGGGGEGIPYSFIVRFRGFEDGGSDKVPGVQTVIPGPATAVLLVCSAIAAGGRRRREGAR